MTLTDWSSVIVIGLSLGSLLVSVVSCVVAVKTKRGGEDSREAGIPN